jgi:hypothetical protein
MRASIPNPSISHCTISVCAAGNKQKGLLNLQFRGRQLLFALSLLKGQNLGEMAMISPEVRLLQTIWTIFVAHEREQQHHTDHHPGIARRLAQQYVAKHW